MSTIRVDASEHPVRSVTIFKSWKAEIVRVFKLSLEASLPHTAGENKVEIRRLSGSINADSVRVAGLGDARLFDVVCALDTETDDDAPDSTPEAIRLLTAAQHKLAQRRDALTAVRSAMATYSQSLSGEHVSPEQADAFFEKYISRSESIADANLDIDEEMLRLSREIKQHAKKQASTKGLSNGKVTCVVVTPHATDVEVKLTYRTFRTSYDLRPALITNSSFAVVGNASWTPIYELHASTENGQHTSSVSLQYRARITQSTGEDWSGVTLSLSTADMMLHNQTIPELVRTVIWPRPTGLFGQPMQQLQQSQQVQLQPMHQQQSQQVPALQQQPQQQQTQQQQQLAWQQQQQVQMLRLAQQQAQQRQAQQQQQQQAQQQTAVPMFGAIQATGSQPTGLFQPSTGGLFGSGGLLGSTLHDRDQDPDRDRDRERAEPEDPEGDWQVADADSQAVVPAPFAEPAAAIVKESPLSVSYAVEGESTVPSDGVPHQVSVANLTFKSTVVHVAVPKAQAVAYVQAKVKNTSDYRLLAGPVNVFLDDGFVSQTSIQTDISPNDTFDCTLGADPAVRIRYTRTAAAQTAPARLFSEQMRTTTYTSRAVLRNTHAFAVRALIVRDALPVAGGGVSTVLRRPDGLAGAKDEDVTLAAEGKGEGRKVRWGKTVDGKGGKKDGMFEWVCALGAGEEIVLETVWDVQAPVHVHWVEK
ncbi:hypothetical protein FA95DRAFT_1589849 [Auriscalpium vulgare]|uniref:Uncharacterized protein n=1 Tax=Auriscalpium vulgare TaxID=40419 RepID=A0ACB8RN72_9AGAM|nr:hypothetical protein FA95DRAFT_1589849 [Auriscalpium vulgare]